MLCVILRRGGVQLVALEEDLAFEGILVRLMDAVCKLGAGVCG